ncbi:hypothetical protein F4818DRAFT_85226 [Hypoxylon cercidicola]|nr:hypothetical protein F4818DRAFT_85226 [Hypoxylon cercidicola]
MGMGRLFGGFGIAPVTLHFVLTTQRRRRICYAAASSRTTDSYTSIHFLSLGSFLDLGEAFDRHHHFTSAFCMLRWVEKGCFVLLAVCRLCLIPNTRQSSSVSNYYRERRSLVSLLFDSSQSSSKAGVEQFLLVEAMRRRLLHTRHDTSTYLGNSELHKRYNLRIRTMNAHELSILRSNICIQRSQLK